VSCHFHFRFRAFLRPVRRKQGESRKLYPGPALTLRQRAAEYFTGNVRIDPLFPATIRRPFPCVCHFERGRDPHGTFTRQGSTCLYGRVGRTGNGKARSRRSRRRRDLGPPKVKHWHEPPHHAMTHIAITGTVNGKTSNGWKSHDEQYLK